VLLVRSCQTFAFSRQSVRSGGPVVESAPGSTRFTLSKPQRACIKPVVAKAVKPLPKSVMVDPPHDMHQLGAVTAASDIHG